MSAPTLPEPTPGPVDNHDLRCEPPCKHWLSAHSFKGPGQSFGDFATCDRCKKCRGFRWDHGPVRPFPGTPPASIAGLVDAILNGEEEPDPIESRDLLCHCGDWLTGHSPKEGPEGDIVTCDACSDCAGFQWDGHTTREFPDPEPPNG